jgi:tetratricopeptide (TPR) repeat protein
MKTKVIFCSLLIMIFLAVINQSCKTHKKAADGYGKVVLADTAQDFVKKGNYLINKKKYEEALVQLNKAIALDAYNAEAYAYRGMAKYYLKDYKGAIEDYDKAVNIVPNYGEVYDLRGVAKADMGDKVGACDDWNKAFEVGFNKAYKMIEKYCLDDTK